MSTFQGIVHEFPEIRIDYFRRLDLKPALACFLSHVHSDHLGGLETLKSGPFIYCSAATKEILLRLKKYPARLNYAKGIFEDPGMQTYKHLRDLLKPIPLDTPTVIELWPGKSIQVTLIDANHCVGAVMFLIEGDGKAVLYTGDIRSEPWWVDSVARNPNIVEYSLGLRTLDRIYLDTSMLSDFPLQTKAQGLRELLEQVAKYPDDTIFCMQAWTYGYEEVWMALSKALKSKIHVDNYKFGVYKSLAIKSIDNRFATQTHLSKEAPSLAGFTCGNYQHEGCLTLDENVRIHSCEKDMGCSVMENEPIVWIQPIVAHLQNGQDMLEVGIGGGGSDLARTTTLEADDIIGILEIITKANGIFGEAGHDIKHVLEKFLVGASEMTLGINMSEFTKKESMTDMIESILQRINEIRNPVIKRAQDNDSSSLPNKITFPYARHSSLPELRHFVRTFRPKDIWPCTVDPPEWDERGITMQELFGDCCSGDVFQHDKWMELWSEMRRGSQGGREDEEHPETQRSAASYQEPSSPILPITETLKTHSPMRETTLNSGGLSEAQRKPSPRSPQPLPAPTAQDEPVSSSPGYKRDYHTFKDQEEIREGIDSEDPALEDSQASTISDRAYETRLRAFETARSNMMGETWGAINLISTTDHHSAMETELGEPKP
ncbi:Metallo-hydrolase/oxidoreductase [Xylariaceae sp. FL0662B]|nr:Metallo-hydrolase/oxidoreductase [Xylariaceae sp. FL0662B]